MCSYDSGSPIRSEYARAFITVTEQSGQDDCFWVDRYLQPVA